MQRLQNFKLTFILAFALSISSFGQSFKLSNSLVEFNFNAKTGEYSITDKRNNKVCIENAYFQLNNLASNQGFTFGGKTETITDELGQGEKLTLQGTKTGQPSLVLEIQIYNNNGCIVLNMGVENTSSAEMRIMEFYPLKGIAYKNFVYSDYKVLDGENSHAFTKITSNDTLKSLNNLLVTFGKKNMPKRSLVMGGLTYNEFQKFASVIKKTDYLEVELIGSDPVGKLVDANSKYMLNDKFYVDFTTDNRFEALEKYGKNLAAANHCDVSGVTIPILNFWYCFIKKFGGDEFRNNSIGTIYELSYIQNSDFLKYSPIGIRLEPDDYALPSNQQGWWDDKHWQMYDGGQLLKPYETMEKWGKKIHEMGGVPFVYCQTGKRSEDYCLTFPNHTLFNNPWAKRSKGRVGWWGQFGDSTAIYWTYDYTDPEFINHIKGVYQNLRKGGIQGIKFDYPETGWSYDGGFEDKYATTTSAYRNIFRLAYEGLGPNRDVQERIPLFGDVAIGVVTTQRTEDDNDRAYPARITKTGLRWYKNRMVANYDHDPINPYHTYPKDSRDGWQAAITMTYTTSGRMEVGKFFEKMTKEMIHDLTRAVPLLASPTNSARPVDAFSGKLYPEVYDFIAKPDWHIVTFYNNKIEGEEWPTEFIHYWTENKQFNPKKMLPNVIGVSLSDKTDDGGLGFDPKKSYYVFDFWNWKFVGKIAGNARIEQELRPGEARVMAIHEAKNHPQFISTNRHLLQGYLDMAQYPVWNAQTKQLEGTSKVIGDETYKIILATNGHKIKSISADNAKYEIKEVDPANSIYELSISTTINANVNWKVMFE